MTSSTGERVIRFAQSIHMRRSTAALIIFFFVTVAAYLVVRPIPTHVAQTNRLVRTTTVDEDGTTVTTTTVPRSTPRATVSPTPVVTPTPDPSATPTPTTTPTPADLTPTPSTDGGLFGSNGASPAPGSTAGTLPGSGQVTPGLTTAP
ncbi:hypothetical protein [Frankia sp. R82]|uniref:hypothetical protein n=1 Tax=Frankia sp. R82 TaxID=2950553 RepID=UPI002044312D|nr:hypothetical protein [Frankia sp. R82]MCM3882798.1 hypothetical protein [Frankia sp. R82]